MSNVPWTFNEYSTNRLTLIYTCNKCADLTKPLSSPADKACVCDPVTWKYYHWELGSHRYKKERENIQFACHTPFTCHCITLEDVVRRVIPTAYCELPHKFCRMDALTLSLPCYIGTVFFLLLLFWKGVFVSRSGWTTACAFLVPARIPELSPGLTWSEIVVNLLYARTWTSPCFFHIQITASAFSHPIQHPTAGELTPMTPVGLFMAGSWQIISFFCSQYWS